MNDNPVPIQGDRHVIVIPQPEFADHLASANPCDIKVRADRGLDRDPSFHGILDDRVSAVRHGHLQRDISFRSCPVDKCHITIRYGGRQSSIGAYSKGPDWCDLACCKSRSGC